MRSAQLRLTAAGNQVSRRRYSLCTVSLARRAISEPVCSSRCCRRSRPGTACRTGRRTAARRRRTAWQLQSGGSVGLPMHSSQCSQVLRQPVDLRARLALGRVVQHLDVARAVAAAVGRAEDRRCDRATGCSSSRSSRSRWARARRSSWCRPCRAGDRGWCSSSTGSAAPPSTTAALPGMLLFAIVGALLVAFRRVAGRERERVAAVAPVAIVVARARVLVEVAVRLARRVVLAGDLAGQTGLVVAARTEAIQVRAGVDAGVDVVRSGDAVVVVVDAVTALIDLALAGRDVAEAAAAALGRIAGLAARAQRVVDDRAAAVGLGADLDRARDAVVGAGDAVRERLDAVVLRVAVRGAVAHGRSSQRAERVARLRSCSRSRDRSCRPCSRCRRRN